MLHILLVILKIIGIVFVAVLGLLLFLFLILMLGPIRYRVAGQAGDKVDIEGNISWLFFVLRCKINYTSEKGLLWYVCILGFLFASNEEAFVAKKEAKQLSKIEGELPVSTEHSMLEQTERQELLIQEDIDKETEIKTKPIKEQTKQSPKKKKKSILGKLKRLLKKGNDFFVNLKKKIISIPKKLASMRDRIIEKKERFLQWKEYFLGEANKEVMKYILSHFKKMLLHILPNRFHGRVEFGLEDPYRMGQILAVLGILMPIYQDKLTVIPDFEEEKLKGDVSLKGIIIPGYLVLHLFILLLNKEVRRIIKEGKQLIGGNV